MNPTETTFEQLLEIQISSFLDQMGMSDLPEEEKGRHMENIRTILTHRMADMITDQLNPEQLAEWEKCETGEQMDAFMTKNNIPIGEILLTVGQQYREEVIGTAAYIQAKLDSQDAPPQA